MPAVNPIKLRFQIEDLLSFFESPHKFHQKLQRLFSLYANRSLRHGELTQPKLSIPTYQLPPPVPRQLHQDILPLINKNMQAGLDLADALWQDAYYEIKQLAIFILGNANTDHAEPILTRLETWLDPKLDQKLKAELLTKGTIALQSDFPTSWERLIQSLLNHNDPKMSGLGIQGLQSGAKRPGFANFPAVFRLISPILQNPHNTQLRELENLVNTLIDISPTETAYFLRQTLSLSSSPETVRLVKKCLPNLPEDLRENLQNSLS